MIPLVQIVLVHSGVTDSGEWDAVRPLLEDRHRVVAPDLPGHGSAPLEPGEVSLADAILGAFDGSAALVGTSFGGRAELEAALAAPGRVTKLVLVSANPVRLVGGGAGDQRGGGRAGRGRALRRSGGP